MFMYLCLNSGDSSFATTALKLSYCVLWFHHPVFVHASQVDSGLVWTRKASQGPSPGRVSFLGFWPVLLSLWMPSTPRRWCRQWMETSGNCLTTTTLMPPSCSSRSSSCLESSAVSSASAASLTLASGAWWRSEECSVLPSATSQAFRSNIPALLRTTSQGLQRPVRRLCLQWCTLLPVKACSGGPATQWFLLARQPTHGSKVWKWRRFPSKTLRKKCSRWRKATWEFDHCNKAGKPSG